MRGVAATTLAVSIRYISENKMLSHRIKFASNWVTLTWNSHAKKKRRKIRLSLATSESPVTIIKTTSNKPIVSLL